MRTTLIAIFAAIPPLIFAGVEWMDARAQRAEVQDGRDSYGEYITDNMNRDEALLAALHDCMILLPVRGGMSGAAGGVVALAVEQPAQEVLDEIAFEYGYEETP
jgi:hypothetical protein